MSALPDHATTLRAFRRLAELAGTSATTTISLTNLCPLTTGITYEFWLVGHNSPRRRPAVQPRLACRDTIHAPYVAITLPRDEPDASRTLVWGQ